MLFRSPKSIIDFSFPCDFDLLSDILNGIDEQGKNQNSVSTSDPTKKLFSMVGGGEGLGQFNAKEAISNKESTKDTDSCNLDVETHLLKRQARMGLLEKDKIALRIVVPWNPKLHAGSVIKLTWKNKIDDKKPVYGAGEYLVVNMTHTIRYGGFSTTSMDCVSQTVGKGEV